MLPTALRLSYDYGEVNHVAHTFVDGPVPVRHR
jgi:hypothetical protein